MSRTPAARRRRTSSSTKRAKPVRRSLRRMAVEPLEDRRMLAGLATVSNNLDVVNGDTSSFGNLFFFNGGDGISLREALQTANNVAGADTINFAPALGTITLNGTQLSITDDVTINGPSGDNITINADGRSRVIAVGGTATAAITRLTLTGGSADRGGGLRNYGGSTTTLSDVVIQGNTATIDGGGVSNAEALGISGSTISGNTAPDGAGIFNFGGSVSIAGSTIESNVATDEGGGVSSTGFTLITNSTISLNVASNGGGGLWLNGIATIRHSTIADNRGGNGGGIESVSAVELDHTIVADNTALFGTGPDIEGTVTANFSLIEDTNDAIIVGANNVTGLDPMLGPLADNYFGPTQTHALLSGSPALDAGDVSFVGPPNNDQRGAPFTRVAGGQIDIGAYESQPLPLVVDYPFHEFDNDFSIGDLSLREAIHLANGNLGADTITFDAALTGSTLNVTQLDISGDVTIAGLGSSRLALASYGGSRIFNIDDGDNLNHLNVTITGLTLTDGSPAGAGGAIRSLENLTLASSVITGNSSPTSGGGIYVRAFSGATATITDTTISGNTIYANYGVGGGITAITEAGGTVTISHSSISGNIVQGRYDAGGGVFANTSAGGNLTISGSTIAGNVAYSNYYAGAYGGGLHLLGDGATTITNSTISGNSAKTRGGGVYASAYGGATVKIVHSTVAGNAISYGSGGGVAASGGGVSLDQSIVAGNLGGGAPDVLGTVAARYTLIGEDTGATITNNGGNLIGTGAGVIDPLLGPLADNGGRGQTHALLPGSPAIDRGDPSFTAPPNFDQRTAPFVRIANGRIDIGAYESQPLLLFVTTDLDETDGDSLPDALSLREAVALANGSVGLETISFDASLDGATILLDSAQIVIRDDLVIDATALSGDLTIDAQQNSRIFLIYTGAGDHTLKGLTLTGGRTIYAGGAVGSTSYGLLTIEQTTITGNETSGETSGGGGVLAYGDVSLIDSVVSNNSTIGDSAEGGAVFARGTLSLTRSTVSGNVSGGDGGGIYAVNNIVLVDSVVSNNKVYSYYETRRGSGIYAGGAITLTDSTVSGNRGFSYAPEANAIFTSGNLTINGSTISDNGGATNSIYAAFGVTIIHSTITQNSAEVFSRGDATISHSTIALNGGGVRNDDDTVTIEHSIIAANDDFDLNPGAGTLLVNHTLIGDADGQAIGGTGNIIGDNQGGGIVDPLLDVLADNGGPTQTHALLPGSPAIDAGDPNAVAGVGDTPEFDQRGEPYGRVQDGDGDMSARIDMGAYEVQPVPAVFFVVDTLEDELDGSIVDGDTSLRDAIAAASSGQTITFSVTGVIHLTLGQLHISKSLTIGGPGASQLTIDAGGNSRIFDIDDGSNFSNRQVLITGLTLTGGNAVGDGGAIRSREGLTLRDSVLTGNMASGNGGGLDARSGSNFAGTFTTSVINTVVSNNSTTGNGANGGGIFVSTSPGATTTISGSIISDNDTDGSNAEGGGISVLNFGTTTIAHSTISGNRSTGASSEGGGIYIDTPNGGATTIYNSTISDNRTDGSSADGGGIYVNTDSGGMTTITGSTISGNSTHSLSSNADGGGVYIKDEGTTRVTASTISGNASQGDGGGIAVSTASGNTTIDHSTIAYNTASPNFFTGRGGGGLFIAAGSLTLDHSIVATNIDNSTTAPDVFGALGASFSLIGEETGATITDNGGNQIGSGSDELNVSIDMAAMGDFEFGGIGRDSYVFEYSLNGGSFQPLFTSVVDEAGSLTYTLEDGSMETLDDPLLVNGTTLDNQFQSLSALVPGSAVGDSLELRLTATSDGGFEAFAFRNITVQWGTSSVIGRALGLMPDMNVTFVQDDPDYNQDGDMFGIRSRTNPGTPGLPDTIVDDTVASPPDNQGIIRSTDTEDFFGVVDTVNLTGNDVNVARWTFDIVAGSIDPHLGPLQDNGGPTETHALLAGSPAIDAGDPGVIFDPTQFDQRGAPFSRVQDGDGDMLARIDLGAFEVQPPTGPACDFDDVNGCDIDDIDALVMEIVAGTDNPLFDLTGDNLVDLADRDQWLADAGALNLMSGNTYLLADSNLDGVVDGQDFILWNGNKFTSSGTWSQADWNADGVTDGQDFIIWNGNKFESSGGRSRPLSALPLDTVFDFGETPPIQVEAKAAIAPDLFRWVSTPVQAVDSIFALWSRRRIRDSDERHEGRILDDFDDHLPINSWVL